MAMHDIVRMEYTKLHLSLIHIFTIRLYRRYHTLDLDEISARLKKEGL